MANRVKHKNKKAKTEFVRSRRGKRDKEAMLRRLRSMTPKEKHTVHGTFSYSGRGFGFCVPDEEYGMPDIFIPPRKTMGAMTGDSVTVELSGEAGERPEGEVVNAEYSCRSIIGTLKKERGYSYFIPDSKRYGVLIYIPESEAARVDMNPAKVEVVPDGEEFFTRTRSLSVVGPMDMPYFDTQAKIGAVFGNPVDRLANYSAILYAADIRLEFPENVLEAADRAALEPIDDRDSGRHDLRDKLILTIDGAGARDLDDAISLEKTEDGYILSVHIADVSHYARFGGVIADEAYLRGTSVYFTDKVVPMLPEALSNGACSLNAGTDKYALTAEITLDSAGRRTGVRIYKSIIRSTVRGVYDEVNDLFRHGADSAFYEKYGAVYGMLCDMHGLYELLEANGRLRGIMELEDSEAIIVLDDNGEPVDVVRRERGDAERLIEQFMLQANFAVAETLKALGLPCLYRIHGKPDREKLRAFSVFAHNLGLDTRGLVKFTGSAEEEKTKSAGNARNGGRNAKDTSGGDMAELGRLSGALMRILDEAAERGIGGIVSSVMLRSMMKAKYQSVSSPHFGLGAPLYCHFTSPIRRYPDLFVHSVITAALEKTGLLYLDKSSAVDPSCAAELEASAHDAGIKASDCEVRAQNAEYAIEDLYMAIFMSRHIGEEFHVTVSSVIRSGLFVQCDNLIEGFIPAAAFPAAHISEEYMTLESMGKVYTLGTTMTARLTEVDISAGKITFGL